MTKECHGGHHFKVFLGHALVLQVAFLHTVPYLLVIHCQAPHLFNSFSSLPRLCKLFHRSHRNHSFSLWYEQEWPTASLFKFEIEMTQGERRGLTSKLPYPQDTSITFLPPLKMSYFSMNLRTITLSLNKIGHPSSVSTSVSKMGNHSHRARKGGRKHLDHQGLWCFEAESREYFVSFQEF